CSSSFCVFFFFFQAEDGIRDFHVTGVQTCALRSIDAALDPVETATWLQAIVDATYLNARPGYSPLPELQRTVLGYLTPRTQQGRSEERRVGKECRSRWSPHH